MYKCCCFEHMSASGQNMWVCHVHAKQCCIQVGLHWHTDLVAWMRWDKRKGLSHNSSPVWRVHQPTKKIPWDPQYLHSLKVLYGVFKWLRNCLNFILKRDRQQDDRLFLLVSNSYSQCLPPGWGFPRYPTKQCWGLLWLDSSCFSR